MTEQATENPADAEETGDHGIIRAKWTMDGAATLAEAAAMLRARAGEFDQMHREGWALEQPVADDYGFLLPPAKQA